MESPNAEANLFDKVQADSSKLEFKMTHTNMDLWKAAGHFKLVELIDVVSL